MKFSRTILALSAAATVSSFVIPPPSSGATTRLQSATLGENQIAKKRLLELIGKQSATDPVLADPITKEPIEIATPGVLLGGERRRNIKYTIQSPSNKFEGTSDTFLNLLEPVSEESASSTTNLQTAVLKQALPYVPAPLRGPFASLTGAEDYIPMRDLFTSPAVSYAYERGWRQGFQRAGFPGPDKETELAMEYFAPVVENADSSVVVDMSCATGKFWVVWSFHV